MGVTNTTRSFTVPVATATAALVAKNGARRQLLLAVNGANPCTFKYGSAPASVTDGFSLDGASSVGGQGGSLLLTGDDCPTDAVYCWSTLGTTISITEGTFVP